MSGDPLTHTDDLRQQLARAQARLAERIAHRDKCDREYRATSDGIAESMRAIELATTPAERRRLITAHARAESDAYAEYEQRYQRWRQEIPEVTGPVKALPCGPNVALTALLVRHQILGSFRFQPDRPVQKITLLRIDAAGTRHRRSFTITGNDSCENLAQALTLLAERHRDRFAQFCGDDYLATQIRVAIARETSTPRT